MLSGDVHHSYISEADYEKPLTSRVFQITCSPIHNTINPFMRLVFHLGWSNTVERIVRGLDRLTRVPPLPIHWHHPTGPHFGNMVGSITFDGQTARARLERAEWTAASDEHEEGTEVKIAADLTLTSLPRITQ